MKKIYKYLIIATLWFIWHLNFELSVGNLIFFIILLAGSIGIAYVADKTKSLIMVALFHSLFNISQSELLIEVELYQKILILSITVLTAIVIMRYDRKAKEKNEVRVRA